MITSRRDYILRLIEELGRLLARVSAKRKRGDTDDAALETIVFGLQRLFALPADQIFLLTPEQHFELLCDGEPPEIAGEKVLLYAALCAEAGHVYQRQGNAAMARAVRLTALRFTLKAHARFPSDAAPAYAPDLDELLAVLAELPLDADTQQLLEHRRAEG